MKTTSMKTNRPKARLAPAAFAWLLFSFAFAGAALAATGAPADGQAQTVVAPALTPSKAGEIRKARAEAEISTESHILEKLEAERLKDEQKRVDSLLKEGASLRESGAPAASSPAAPASSPSSSQWFLGEKAFVSLGGGFVKYWRTDNVESDSRPSPFISIGGYGLRNFLFDFTGYYSNHRMRSNGKYQMVQQGSLALSVKLSPLRGNVKPYAGIVGVYNMRRYKDVDSNWKPFHRSHASLGANKWHAAVDVGPAIGVDIALVPRIGVNAGIFWLFNVMTEESKAPSNHWAQDVFLSQKQSVAASLNFRFYF